METFLYIVFFLSCIVLVTSVLLQPGKTDAGALFTSGVSSAAMNPRGTASVLSKLTIVTATIFMLSALLLTLPALTGNVSVLQTQGENAPAATDTNTNSENANAENNANSNVATDAENSEGSTTDETESAESPTDVSTEKTDEAKAEDKKEENK